uniref:Uncharacterized protein n=1 Tax=Rousettus aegyptiacus TaxID=9407 RepID=A0A7J8C2F1_ROUAE|nr:hypothetical protein HJG63_009344 [Rousettus aegyptiacus]
MPCHPREVALLHRRQDVASASELKFPAAAQRENQEAWTRKYPRGCTNPSPSHAGQRAWTHVEPCSRGGWQVPGGHVPSCQSDLPCMLGILQVGMKGHWAQT